MGGSWLTALTSDLGNGKLDGAWLVQNFENQNPSNTLWTKQYNLYSKIDTEAPRYLHFEKWWGGHINLNAEEIQFIVDELFIGNNLAAGRIQASDGSRVDLRNIRSPILVFCSRGDNITPPQQALGWLLDLYQSVDEIRSYGQTIVYTIHDKIGHLGIFVSGSVAKKEHGEFSSNIDLIDTLPPGLYEAVIEQKQSSTAGADLVSGDWVMRCEARTLDDIRALGGNDAADDRRFATAARVSEINLAFYRTFVQPLVRSLVTPAFADRLIRLHPLRLQYELFSDANPLMKPLAGLAERVRGHRRPVNGDNPFIALQEKMSDQIVASLDAWLAMNEKIAERAFLSIYGQPRLQSAVGIDPTTTTPARRAPKSALHRELVRRKAAEIKSRMRIGGAREAVIRSLLYIGMAEGTVDERGFEITRRLRKVHGDLPLADFKALVRDQFSMLILDESGALEAISMMLPSDPETRHQASSVIKQVLGARGDMTEEQYLRYRDVSRLFELDLEAKSDVSFAEAAAAVEGSRPTARVEGRVASVIRLFTDDLGCAAQASLSL
jgi:hypothetical protein